MTSSGDGTSNPDIAGMALQALAKYQDQPAVTRATEEVLACISKKQNSESDFSSQGARNSESYVWIIVALRELGILLDDPRFVKNGNTSLDNLVTFCPLENGFLHMTDGSGSNQMAPEQAFYGLIAAQRLQDDRNSLYQTSDVRTILDGSATGPAKGAGLEGKDPTVHPSPITQMGKTFGDTTGVNAHKNQPAIKMLAARDIIDDESDGGLDPEGSMTHAEFTIIMVRALGFAPEGKNSFSDVAAEAWYAPYVRTVYSCGITTGVGNGQLNPSSTIARQKVAIIASCAAKLCGSEAGMGNATTQNMLAQFPDCIGTAEWARAPLALYYQKRISNQTELNTRLLEAITRAEVAQILFDLLSSANLPQIYCIEVKRTILNQGRFRNQDNVVCCRKEEVPPRLARELTIPDLFQRVEEFQEIPTAEGMNISGYERTTLKFLIPNLVFSGPIGMGENVWIYMGKLCPAYCLYIPQEDGEERR